MAKQTGNGEEVMWNGEEVSTFWLVHLILSGRIG